MRPRRFQRVLAAAVVGVLGGFAIVELVVRARTDSLLLWNSTDDRSRYGIVDPVVGHRIKPSIRFRHPRKHFSVTMEADGTRSVGSRPARERPLTLATGDSFTFGDQVDDADVWPAQLQRLTGARVVNGGMPGFGLDQAVLWTEHLAQAYAPDTIVVDFIPHDIVRCEMSAWSGNPKPWFERGPSGLVFHPLTPPPARRDAWLRHLLSFSVTLDLLFTKYIHWDVPDRFEHHDGVGVACGLMRRLAALRQRSAKIVVVAQPQQVGHDHADIRMARSVLACAAQEGLGTVDLFTALQALPRDEQAALYSGHFTPKGNRWFATELLAALDH